MVPIQFKVSENIRHALRVICEARGVKLQFLMERLVELFVLLEGESENNDWIEDLFKEKL